jgi:hypothetical protein
MKDCLASIGPCAITQYPRKAWSRWPTGTDATEIWKICGSTVELHMKNLPLWMVFCAVYYEGLIHGSDLQKEMDQSKEKSYAETEFTSWH